MRYQKTQVGTLLLILLLIVPIVLLILAFLQTGTRPLPINIAILIALFMFGLALMFYKLSIKIDNEKITATFGIGFLKRTMFINEMDFNSIEKIKFSLLTGIGIRMTKKGWLWNVKVGDAILIKNKTNSKTFLVGTDEFENIKKILNDGQH